MFFPQLINNNNNNVTILVYRFSMYRVEHSMLKAVYKMFNNKNNKQTKSMLQFKCCFEHICF